MKALFKSKVLVLFLFWKGPVLQRIRGTAHKVSHCGHEVTLKVSGISFLLQNTEGRHLPLSFTKNLVSDIWSVFAW